MAASGSAYVPLPENPGVPSIPEAWEAFLKLHPELREIYIKQTCCGTILPKLKDLCILTLAQDTATNIENTNIPKELKGKVTQMKQQIQQDSSITFKQPKRKRPCTVEGDRIVTFYY